MNDQWNIKFTKTMFITLCCTQVFNKPISFSYKFIGCSRNMLLYALTFGKLNGSMFLLRSPKTYKHLLVHNA